MKIYNLIFEGTSFLEGEAEKVKLELKNFLEEQEGQPEEYDLKDFFEEGSIIPLSFILETCKKYLSDYREIKIEGVIECFRVSIFDETFWGDLEEINGEKFFIDYKKTPPDVFDLQVDGVKEKDLYIDGWECTIEDFCENPGEVYHWTTEQGVMGIIETGFIQMGTGSSFSNVYQMGVFTSAHQEVNRGTYGDFCLKIDLENFKETLKEGLSVTPEEEVLVGAKREYVFRKLVDGIQADHLIEEFWETNNDSNYGQTPDTVIVQHPIPIRFVEIVDGDGDGDSHPLSEVRKGEIKNFSW